MRISKEALALRVVVRRVRTGTAPFCWEVHRDPELQPIHVSHETFRSMEAAYGAGLAKLADFIPQRRTAAHQPAPDA